MGSLQRVKTVRKEQEDEEWTLHPLTELQMMSMLKDRLDRVVKDIDSEIVVISALGNALIRRCRANNVKKKNFLEQMKISWENHEDYGE